MKEQDLIHALSNLPQDLLDELDEWQKSGAPLTGRDADDTSSVQTDKPVLTRRRNIEMKQRKDKRTVRPWAWTAGIAAAVILCTAVAVPVGKEAIRRTDQKNAGYTESEAQPAAGVSEDAAQQKQVPLISFLLDFHGENENSPAVPENGEVRVLRSMDDWQQLAADTDLISSDTEEARFNLIEDTFTQYDVLYFAYKGQQLPANYLRYFNEEFTGASLSADGTLTVRYSAFLLTDPQTDLLHKTRLFENYHCLYTVPKNELPDISGGKVSVEYTETYYDEKLPDRVIPDLKDRTDQTEPISYDDVASLTSYVQNTQEYKDWRNSLPEHLFITWNEKEPAQPEGAEQTYVTEQSDDAFYAWFWDGYSGDDIPLDGITVDVIRTAADGKRYLTGSGQQNDTALTTFLSADWLEKALPDGEAIVDPVSGTHISHDGQPHDIIFIGVPASELPRNTVIVNYHNGTLTPSGELHIDLSVLTVTDAAQPMMPADRQYDETKNRYFFISVPAGEIPDAIVPVIGMTEYHTDELPPEDVTDPTAAENWYWKNRAGQGFIASVFGNKDIHRIPEQTGSVTTIYARVSEKPEFALPDQAPERVTFRTYDDGTSKIVLAMLVDKDAKATALTDLHVSADGVLSLTLHELCQSEADLTEAAWIQWELVVPSGVLPDITRCNMQLSATTDEDAFMQLAGQLITITKD